MQRERALHHLKTVRREIAHLTAIEQPGLDGSISADDRIGFRAEWTNVVDRFSAVVGAYAEGQLDRETTSVGRCMAPPASASVC